MSGWDDPRMPTLCGLRKRGVPPEALRLFVERTGVSKADNNIDYAVLEDCVREVLDPSAARAMAVLEPLKVTITNWPEGTVDELEVPRHESLARASRSRRRAGVRIHRLPETRGIDRFPMGHVFAGVRGILLVVCFLVVAAVAG